MPKVILQKEIAELLNIASSSLNSHLARIRKKLRAHNTADILRCTVAKTKRKRAKLLFTQKGKKIFILIIKGYKDAEIAEKINISYQGVRRHKEKMLSQNCCATMRELLAKYYRTYEVQKKKEED